MSTTSAHQAHDWVGATLGNAFALHLLARANDTAERVQVELRQGVDKSRVPRMSGIVATLRSLPPAFQATLASEVTERFNRKLSRIGQAATVRAGFSADSLSLVGETQMRIEITVTRAAQTLRDEVGAEFYALTRRLCFLTDQEDIRDADNPAYVTTLLDALMTSLSTTVETDDLLVAIFEALMVEAEHAITDAYRDVNAEMIKRGVLIEIKDILIRSRPNPREAERQANTGAGGSGGAGGGGGSGGGSGAAYATSSASADAHPGGGASASPSRASGSKRTGGLEVRGPAPVDQLRHTGIHEALSMPANIERLLRSDQLAAIAANVLAAADSEGAREPKTESPRASGDAFDASKQIALDASVSASILKVFEAIKQHDALKGAGGDVWNLLLPAYIALAEHHGGIAAIREDKLSALTCLNRFADYIAAVQPRPDSIDERYESMLRVAEWLVSASRVSDNAFAMAAEKLDAALDQYENEAAQARAETKTIADFEVLDEARQAARNAIMIAMGKNNVPLRVRQFAEDVGFDLLITDFLNGGPRGDLWQRDVETFEMLIDSLRPARSREDRALLARTLPVIVSRLAEGLPRVSRSQADLKLFLDDLKPLYERAAEGLEPEPVDSRDAIAKIAASAGLDTTTAMAPLPNLRELRWVILTERDGANGMRCRIVWVSPAKTIYLLRNYQTREYFALPMPELAQRFRGGYAQVASGLELITPFFAPE